MDLAEGRGREGCDFEIGECFRHANAEFGRDNFFHFVEGEWLHLVLQAGERFEIGARQQFHAGGEKLAELHEGRAELFQIVRQLAGFGRFLRRDPLLGIERFLESGSPSPDRSGRT